MRIHIALLAIALLCACELPSAHAYDERHQAMVFGVGQKTCGQMTDDVKVSDYGRQAYESYILGYLSAVNTSFRGSTNFFAGGDSAGWYKFVLLYCESHPLDPVILAVEKLVKHYKNDFPRSRAAGKRSLPKDVRSMEGLGAVLDRGRTKPGGMLGTTPDRRN